jgi:transposase
MPVSIEVVFGQQTLTVKWPSSDPEGCARFIRGLIAAIEAELQALQAAPTQPEKKQKPKRAALPAEFPRTLIHHEPDNTHCSCGCALKRIGEEVSEKLDYTPGVFTVERHVRGKWVCDDCETLIQAPVPAQIIDKGIPTANAASK